MTVTTPAPQLAAMDLAIGSIVAQREVRLDSQAFGQFAALTGDAHPIHYDAGYARGQGLKAPVAHGLLLVAISALGTTALSAQLHDAMVAMLGVDADFRRPVYLDDTVRCTYRIEQIEHGQKSRSKVRIAVTIEALDEEGNPGGEPNCRVHLRFLLKTNIKG